MQHEFGVRMDEFDQSKKEALVTSSVQVCGFLFEFKACGLLPYKSQTLSQRKRQRATQGLDTCFQGASEDPENTFTNTRNYRLDEFRSTH